MKKITFIILLALSGICLEAQTSLDSLYTVWQDQDQSDSTRAAAYKQYIWDGFLFTQPDTAFILAKELLSYGLDKNYLKAQAMAYNTQGVTWYLRGDYSKALGHYNQSLEIQKQIGDEKGIATCLNNIGLIYVIQGDYPRALDFYTQGLKIEEEIGNQKGIAQSLNNIGIIYNNQSDYDNALDYYNRSLKIKEQIGDQIGVAASLNNIGVIYEYRSDFPQALDHHTRSLKIKEQLGDQKGIAQSLNNIGIIYNNLGEYPRALDYYNQSLKIKEQIGDQRGIAQSLHNIGFVYYNQGNYSKALEYCRRSYELALEIGALEIQKSGCSCLYDSYKASSNETMALEYHEILIIINDSLDAGETTRKLQQMEFQKAMFQDSVEKAEEARLVQEAHTEEIRRKNRTKNVFLASGIILIFLSFGLWRGLQYVRRSRKEIAEEKEKSENLLLNILPKEIAEELKQTGLAKPRKYENVSILFTDFVDFTKISEQMSPEELVAEINACYKSFDQIIEERGIEKIKTIGDAYLAVDGFGKEGDEAAKNILLAALEIVEFTRERKEQNKESGKPAFDIRAGIHTGDVVAGIVGVKKFQFDIWGNDVNTASRMETHSEVGKVNLSQATFELVKNDPLFAYESRGEREVKGKGEMEMWFVKKKPD